MEREILFALSSPPDKPEKNRLERMMALLPQAIVQCKGFRCLAFHIKDGWVDSHGEPLEVVRVINVIFDPTKLKKD